MTARRFGRMASSWPLCIISMMWLSLFVQTDYFAKLHGMAWPVVTPITVTSVESETVNGHPGSRVQGMATIQREQCDYIDVSFRLQGSDREVSVAAFFADPARVREGGKQSWEALMVGVPPHRLSRTIGEVRHECGIFPVVSPFFVPDESIVPTSVGATAQCASGAYTTSTGPGTCSGHGGVKEWMTG